MCDPQGITENNTQQFSVPLDALQILIDHQNKKEKIARRRTKQQKRKFDKQNGSDFKDLIHEEVTKLPELVLLNVDLSNLKEKPQDKKEGSQQQEESSKRQKIDICVDSKMKQFSQQKEKVVGIGLHKITKSIEQENEKEKQRKAYRPMFTKLLHQLSGVTTPKNHQEEFLRLRNRLFQKENETNQKNYQQEVIQIYHHIYNSKNETTKIKYSNRIPMFLQEFPSLIELNKRLKRLKELDKIYFSFKTENISTRQETEIDLYKKKSKEFLDKYSFLFLDLETKRKENPTDNYLSILELFLFTLQYTEDEQHHKLIEFFPFIEKTISNFLQTQNEKQKNNQKDEKKKKKKKNKKNVQKTKQKLISHRNHKIH